MAKATINMRAGYAARAGYGGGPQAWRALSEGVDVEVEALDVGEAPLAYGIVRPFGCEASEDMMAWDIRHGLPGLGAGGRRDLGKLEARVTARGPQRLELRMSGKGLLAPVLGPDAVGPLSPDAFARYDADFKGNHVTRFGRDMLGWRSRPGQPSPGVRKARLGERWPKPRKGCPGMPVHLCEDAATSGLRVDPVTRSEAIEAFMADVAGLCLVEGALWRPCKAPLVAIAADGRARLVIPGLDPVAEVSGHAGNRALAFRDAGAPMPPGMSPEGASVRTFPAAREARGLAALNAVALAEHLGDMVANVRVGGLAPSWLPLVHCLAMVAGGSRDDGTVERVALLVHASLEACERPAPGSHDADLSWLMSTWRRMQAQPGA